MNASEITSYFLSFGSRPHSHILKLNLWLISFSCTLRPQWEILLFDWRWMEADRNMLATACGVGFSGHHRKTITSLQRKWKETTNLSITNSYILGLISLIHNICLFYFLFQYGKGCWIISLEQCCHVSCSSCWTFWLHFLFKIKWPKV